MNQTIRHMAVLFTLAAAITAAADVRVFVTPASAGYGLTIPDNAFIPTYIDPYVEPPYGEGNDYSEGHFVVASFPPVNAPSGTPDAPIAIAQGDFVYIWFQFVDEPADAHVNGIELTIDGPTGAFVPTYYRQDDSNGDPAFKRWDGTATYPHYPEWHENPQALVGITAGGLRNGDDRPQNMHEHQSGTALRTGVALLGAIQFTRAAACSIAITEFSYVGAPNPDIADAAYFAFIPEPASLLLLGCCLLIRRR